MTQFILEQQELKLKKISKSRKKRKQNTEEDEGKCLVRSLSISRDSFFRMLYLLCFLRIQGYLFDRGHGGGLSWMAENRSPNMFFSFNKALLDLRETDIKLIPPCRITARSGLETVLCNLSDDCAC